MQLELGFEEERFAGALAQELVRSSANVVDTTERLIEQYLVERLTVQCGSRLIKSATARIHNHYFRSRFATLYSLAQTGYETWYAKLKFSTALTSPITDMQITCTGIRLMPFEYGGGVRRDYELKSKTLKRQINHSIELKHFTLTKELFQRTVALLHDHPLLTHPYRVNFLVGPGLRGYRLVSFDHLLTGERSFCNCAQPAHTQMMNTARERSHKHVAGSWPHQILEILESAQYQQSICHLCFAQTNGPDKMAQYYGDAFRKYVPVYVDQIMRSTDLDEQTAKAEAQQRLGLSRWVSEAELYSLIKQIFPNETILREASPPWLGRQRLDIFIPALCLAIEYQGQQHYQAVEMFGGADSFQQVMRRDEQKRNLCKANGIEIVEIRFDQPLTLPYLRNRLRRFIGK